jgi:hypothetical protein
VAHDCYIASLFWFGAYSVAMLSLDYFPERYRIHLLVPLAVNVAAGISLFQEAGVTGVTSWLGRMHPAKRVLALTVFGVPTAAIWAPLLATGYQLIGGDAAHLRVRAASVAVALALTVLLLDRELRRGQSVLPFIVFPILAVMAWLVADRLGREELSFWPRPEHGPWTWALGMGWLALLVAWAVTRRSGSWRPWIIPVAAAAYAVVSVVRILPSYITPQYTMKQVSESLGRELAEVDGIIATGRAESLFNGNTLRYWNDPSFGERRPDALVVVFARSPSGPGPDYRLVAAYRLFVSPSYVPPANWGEVFTRSQLPVRLYVRQ